MLWLVSEPLIWAVTFFKATFLFVPMLVIDRVIMPVARRMPREWLPKSIKQRLEEETYLLNVTFKTFLTILRIVYRRHSTKLQDGMTAPNPKVETFDKKTVHLLDFVKQNRPLVVNFGSCT